MERKFLITADIHFGLYRNLGLLDENMLTPQARFIEKAMLEIKDYAVENSITTLIVLGDCYHTRNIRTDAINNLVSQVFKEIESAGIEIYIIAGNHDQSSQSGVTTAIQRLATDKIHIYNNPALVTILGVEWVFLPFQEHRKIVESLNELRKDFSQLPKFLGAHLGVSGATVGAFEKKIMEPVNLNDLHPDDFIQMYFGHYHKKQQIGKNALYTGAICQHCFGDSGDERGFWDVEIVKEPDGWKAINTFIPINSTPKFYKIPVEDFVSTAYRNIDYVKVTGVSAIQRQELQEKYPKLILEGEDTVTTDDEIIMSIGDSFDKWVETWVNENMDNRRKRRSLVKMGNEIMGKIEE